MSIYDGILHGLSPNDPLGKIASIRGALARAATWGIPMGKYTGPAPLGLLVGGGGYKRKMLAENLYSRLMAGGKIRPIEKDIIAKGMGISREAADQFIQETAKRSKAGRITKALTSETMGNIGGGMLGRNVPKFLAMGGLMSPFAAMTAPVMAAGAGAGMLRNMATRAINRRALHERLVKNAPLTLSEQKVFDRMKAMNLGYRVGGLKKGLKYTVPAAGLGTAAYLSQ